MKVKKTISLFIIINIIISIFSFSVFPSSAAATTSPRLDLVRGTNCFNVVWSKTNKSVKYRLYFGVNNKFRCYTDLSSKDFSTHPKYTGSLQFLMNKKALTGRRWIGAGEEKGVPTYNISSYNTYKCQIEMLSTKNKHLAWSNVAYVIIGKPSLSAKTNNNNVTLSWTYMKGVNHYQIAYRKINESYSYKNIINYNVYTLKSLALDNSGYSFQVRPYKTSNNRVAYGTWSSVIKVPRKTQPVSNTSYEYKENTVIGSLTAKAVGISNVSVALGISQSTIDNFPMGMYYRYADPFGDHSIAIFGHNYNALGKIKNMSNGNIITLTGGGRTINYKVYYKGVCSISNSNTYLIDNSTGAKITPFADNTTKDLYLITCHESMANTDYVVRAKRV